MIQEIFCCFVFVKPMCRGRPAGHDMCISQKVPDTFIDAYSLCRSDTFLLNQIFHFFAPNDEKFRSFPMNDSLWCSFTASLAALPAHSWEKKKVSRFKVTLKVEYLVVWRGKNPSNASIIQREISIHWQWKLKPMCCYLL